MQVVAYADRDPAEVYTLSAGGIMLARAGAAAELTTLERWLAEAAAFAQLRARPAFRGFRAWKRFRIWWRTVRLEKVAAARMALEGSLVVQVCWLGACPTSALASRKGSQARNWQSWLEGSAVRWHCLLVLHQCI